MKEVKLNKKYQGNLLSIKLPSDDLDRRFFIKKLCFILHSQLCNSIMIECSRFTYEYSLDDLKKEVEENSKRNNSIYSFANNFEFRYVENNFKHTEILNILPKLWFAFEHISICFSNIAIINFNIFYRKPWYEIVNMINTYIIFKGVEDDIIWIGKSRNLDFKEILNI